MSEFDLKKIADNADMIVRGYAFTRKGEFISVLNLNNPDRAVLLSASGRVLESNTDEIEEAIIRNIWNADKKYMEKLNA